MARLGSCLFVLLVFTGCLEQELDVFNADEVTRLLTLEDKVWIGNSSNTDTRLSFQSATQDRFLITYSDGDTISYGTWSITSDVNGNFTDSLLLQQIIVDPSNPLADVTFIDEITFQTLELSSNAEVLLFKSE